uniref:Uncharacterized protein n=1 Tax=Phytophthora fragariae TaxID=53985 RepID=A0A6A3EG06_9STRA|nr:hypothetical protein PF009_g20814 [Phytophthora fragariae]
MTTANDIKVEGATTFSASVASSFRYAIEIKDEKLSVWMEDCSSKKQWYTGEMEKATYITAINSIMAASSTDYVELFRDALDSDLNSSGQMQRKLTTLNGGSIRLELALPVRALRSVWLAEYKFDLEPVSVERIDILESKLRDQEEKLEKLQIHGTTGQNAAFVQLVASKKDDKSRLRWNKFESDDFSVNGDDGVVKIDGVTAFALPLATSYRYAIELKSSKMSIWMEDRISKKQWYKGGMAKTDYVSDANVIPDATVADYVKVQ